MEPSAEINPDGSGSAQRSERLTQSERTALSDARMLAAAVSLICEYGTEKTTLKAVGERAGYSRGLVSYRFGSKAGLFEFVVRSIGERWLETLKRVTAGKAGLEALAAATEAHRQFCLDDAEHVRAFYILWFDSIGPGSVVREVIAGIHERRQHDVTQWIARGVEAGALPRATDAGRIAQFFCVAIVGIVYQWLLAPDDERALDTACTDLMAAVSGLLPGTQSMTS